MLFQFEFKGEREFAMEGFWQGREEDRDVMEFAGSIVRGTITNMERIDAEIRKSAEHWVIERMAAVDRNILRAATYEILFLRDIPPAVVINEALEVAKRYSSSESVPFINGILDRISRLGPPANGGDA